MRTRAVRPTESNVLRRLSLPLALIAFTGFGFALYRFGLRVLEPTTISWFRGDSVWHFLVWHFFRREPWSFPPGQVEGFMAPLGTSIGAADALPLLAFPFKLFSAALPPDFQYLGLWLFLSYVLQGIFGYLLVRTFCPNRWLALLAGLFFLFSPIMIFRAGHIALASHWILLFALWHYFATARRPAFQLRRYAGLWLLIIALVGLIHPYLAAMVFPIAFVSLLREWTFTKRLKRVQALGLFTGMIGVLGLEWWLSGLIGTGQNLEMWGFDYFSMNLNALVNPLNRSRLLPSLPVRAGQYEGFAYLGLGMLILGTFALVLLLRTSARTAPRRVWGRLRTSGHLPLAFVALGFALFALGRTLTVGALSLFELPLFTNFVTLTATFRAPGRFIWPVYYLLYLAILVYLMSKLRPSTVALLLGLGLLVQVGDLKIGSPFNGPQQTLSAALKDERWPQLIAPFETIVVIPPYERTTARAGDYADFAYLAASHGKALTTGAAARPPRALVDVKEALEVQALAGPRDSGSLYVFGAVALAQRYLTKLEPGLSCYPINAYVVCDSTGRDLGLGPSLNLASYLPRGYERISLADYLKRYEDQTLILVSKEGVGEVWGTARDFLRKKGSEIGRLAPEDAYVAVLHRGRLIFQTSTFVEAVDFIDPDDFSGFGEFSKPVLLRGEWEEGDTLGTGEGALILPKSFSFLSGEVLEEQVAHIVVGGAPAMQSDRGLNAVVLDSRFDVVSAAIFDTQVTDEGVIEKR